jgi:uncharacterized protein with FMN-binding domain
MQRAPIILSATVFGTVGVLAFHPHSPAVRTATASTAPPAATATAAAGSGTKKTATTTATGDAVSTQYGNAQVKVTVENGKITAIEALQLQDIDSKSVQISSSAEPILREEVLQAQSADVQAVSGASYTSASYLQSVQSALTQLGF